MVRLRRVRPVRAVAVCRPDFPVVPGPEVGPLAVPSSKIGLAGIKVQIQIHQVMTSTDLQRITPGSRTGALADHLTGLIRDGRLATGAKLPSVRELGRLHRCSLTTVLQALERLEREDLIVGIPRSGHFVKSPRDAAATPRRVATSLDVVRGRTHGILRRILEMGQTGSIAPFHGAVPAPELLPLSSLRRALAGRLSGEEAQLGRYAPVAGSFSARSALARFLAPRGLKVDPQSLVLTNGCSEALALAIEATSRPGDVVAIESPAFFGLVSLLEQLGRRVVEIPVDPDRGMRLDLLEEALRLHPVQAVVASPDFQNPTGACMDLQARCSLLALATRHDCAVIEDAIYAHCGFAGRPLPSLHDLDDTGNVLHCSSFSKCLAPGLRAGWIAPGRRLREVEELHAVRSLGGPLILQGGWTEFLETSACERHFRAFPKHLWSQVQRMRAILVEDGPAGLRLSSPSGGFVLWLELPGLDSLEFFERAVQAGVGVVPGPVFSSHARRYRHCLRVSCGHPFTPRLEAAARRLARLLREST